MPPYFDEDKEVKHPILDSFISIDKNETIHQMKNFEKQELFNIFSLFKSRFSTGFQEEKNAHTVYYQ